MKKRIAPVTGNKSQIYLYESSCWWTCYPGGTVGNCRSYAIVGHNGCSGGFAVMVCGYSGNYCDFWH